MLKAKRTEGGGVQETFRLFSGMSWFLCEV